MEQINYKEEYKRLFSADIENTNAIELESIKTLLDKFPFCQSLNFFYAACLKNDSEKFDSYLPKAAILDPQRETLYQTLHYLEKFRLKDTPISDLQDEVRPEIESADMTESEILIGDDIDDIDNIREADYFTLDESDGDPVEQPQTEEPDLEEIIKSSTGKKTLKNFMNADSREVSRYNDDKLPYTFLWWLNKTRKEHSETYQPYVNFKLDTSHPIRKNAPDELNQQIIENIFHLAPAFNDKERKDTPPATVEFELKKKEEDIIEKFIKEDPQIRPMQPEKISTENKARKSAEDLYDLVSETLARIYTDQMLFHKAIDTYKKLSLKFPEKNAYFADQISELEKRIN